MAEGSEGAQSEAERIYAEALGRVEDGTALDIDLLCAAHREVSDELRRLDRAWSEIQGLVGPLTETDDLPSSSRVPFPPGRLIAGTLTGSGRDSDEVFTSELIERLRGHGGGYGRYQQRGEVARGGQGIVLRVWDDDLRRVLAMKVILARGTEKSETPRPGETRSLGRFLEEAQVTSQLDHPGIVPVHELGVDPEGRVYFTMKLVKGRNLSEVFDLVRGGDEEWSLTRALGVMLKVCEALAYAHSKGVIHRDLKPSNVMVGKYGEVYVMDWGLAQVLVDGTPGEKQARDLRFRGQQADTVDIQSERQDQSGTPGSPLYMTEGTVVGTPAYMPPEQAVGNTDAMGPHSDVYAVGAMLYHLFTGQMPFVAAGSRPNNFEVWNRVQRGPPRPIDEITGDVPGELVAICEKAMRRAAAQRYPDTLSMAEDIRAYLENRVVRAYRTGALVELRKWVGRNRTVAATVAALLTVTIGAGFLLALAESRRAGVVRAQYNEQLAASLVLESERSWPVHPDSVDSMRRWIDQAEPLIELGERMQEPASREVRAGTNPSSDETASRGSPSDSSGNERVEPFEEKHARVFIQGYRDYLVSNSLELRNKRLDSERHRKLEHDNEILELEIPFLEEQLANEAALRRGSELGGFAEDLEQLASRIGAVRDRLNLAEGLADATLTSPADAWEACGASIQDRSLCPLYAGLVLLPQLGLIPLGRDEASGLWEFWHVLSGERPARMMSGEYRVRPETGLVFILVPGASAIPFGAQSGNPSGANYDRDATRAEGPIRRLDLEPYFLSKYELTQGQWLRLVGRNPSAAPAGFEFLDNPRISRTHPVENVSLDEALRYLPHWGVTVPTEAQWERAARGGLSEPYVTDSDPLTLEGRENIADGELAKLGFDPRAVAPWNDGYTHHAPVDAFEPSPFGFYSMLGNVLEWTRDRHCPNLSDQKVEAIDPTTGELIPVYGLERTVRGGSFKSEFKRARVAFRTYYAQYTRDEELGLRPSIAIAME